MISFGTLVFAEVSKIKVLREKTEIIQVGRRSTKNCPYKIAIKRRRKCSNRQNFE